MNTREHVFSSSICWPNCFHEIESEAEERPDWIDTAIDGVNAILDRMAHAP